MKVIKELQVAPKTPTYTVEDPDGYDYMVLVLDNEAHCAVHGNACDHAKAVEDAMQKGTK